MKIVISQSMLFPWVGLLEQIRLADVFVHYNDVAFSKGSFVNRVQIKTSSGITWMTVPLEGLKLGQKINESKISNKENWKKKHLNLLSQNLKGAPYLDDALKIVHDAYESEYADIGELSKSSMLAACKYFNIDSNKKFIDVETMGIEGKGSDRVLKIVKALNGKEYITGHGAANYLDHETFEENGVVVSYMSYQKRPYPQFHGPFNPYVSCLDLIAHCGPSGIEHICSQTEVWTRFLEQRTNVQVSARSQQPA